MRIQKPRGFYRLDFGNCRIWILSVCLLTLISCIPYLIPIPLDEAGAPVNEDAISEILEVPHSKAEVKEIFRRLPPMRDEMDILVYRWRTKEWVIFLGFYTFYGGGAGGGASLPADNILIITFDNMGMVDRYKIIETGASQFSDEEISQAIAELKGTSTGTDENGEW